MSYHPAGVYQPDHWVISSHSLRNCETRIGNTNVSAAIAWVANLAVYVPFVTDIPCTVYEYWYHNGTLTTAHNAQLAVYRDDLTQVGESAVSTTTTASIIINTAASTDLTLVPGRYYMAFADDSTRNFIGTGDAVGLYQAGGVVEQTGIAAGPNLPDPMVPVTYTRAFLPHFGLNLRTVDL